jgi:hypothetical protein
MEVEYCEGIVHSGCMNEKPCHEWKKGNLICGEYQVGSSIEDLHGNLLNKVNICFLPE